MQDIYKSVQLSRRDALKLGLGLAGAVTAEFLLKQSVEATGLSWNDGKYQTFPRGFVKVAEQKTPVTFNPDFAPFGPDADTLVGLDFDGDIPTGSPPTYKPSGTVTETRVVALIRANPNLTYVQFQDVLGGDRFDMYKMSDHGGDQALDQIARDHAKFSAHNHQKVIYLGDLSLFMQQYGQNEKPLLSRIISATYPGKPELGIGQSNFAEPHPIR